MASVRVALSVVLLPPAALLAAFCAAMSIAAQWGRVSLQLDVLAHFAPFWLLGSAVGLTLGFLARGWARWSVVATGLVGVIAAGSLILPEFLRPTGPHASVNAPEQLKIVQFNVRHANPNPEAILAWLDAERPDIAVIEENSSGFRQAVAAHRKWSVACRGCEVMVLSRKPALNAAPAQRNHPSTPLTHAQFQDGRGLFEVIGLHNAWPTDEDQPIQEARLAEAIAARRSDRLIVVGDFNSAPWSFQRRRWDRIFGLVRRDRAIPSWPARAYMGLRWLGQPFLPIDHVYAGPGWATVSVRRGPRLSSDHYPLVITLAPVAPR
jgi:endonuclease/exonuclease/phosphatase (EEP) superfamily protein YafD